MWIKICGITSLEDAEVAIAAGADALGFVFAESPRRVTPQAVRDITEKLSQPVEKIGVFVDPSFDDIIRTFEAAGLTGVQLHGSHAHNSQSLRTGVGKASRVLDVVRYDGDPARFAAELGRFHCANGSLPDAVLIDTCVAGKQGGTGIAFDWTEARESFRREAPHLRLIAAGGLCLENIRRAIQTLEPWGVDVSSGVETSPGKKDPRRITEFIRAAREAWAELGLPAQV